MSAVRTIPEMRRRLEALGCTLEENRDGDYITLYADAPYGQVWLASLTHVLAANTHKGPRSWTLAMLADLKERVDMGLGGCSTPSCDVCEEGPA